MKNILNKAVHEIVNYREDIEIKLLEFAKTDLLFFWSEKNDLYLRQKKEWQPILDWVEDTLLVKINTTSKLDVPNNEELQNSLKGLFVKMTEKELACYYAAALNMKSVLLALALVKGKIDAKEAGKLSYLEELWQNEMWGNDEEAIKRRKERCDELVEIESYLKQ